MKVGKKLRGVGDVLGIDPHKKMLKKSKRLSKKFKTGDFDYGAKMFHADAWRND